jgi:mannose-1-phosphate guanylyltransferase / phosphomannomutase
MKAVVMAGGEGTRLRPMTVSMPKPLLPIVNKPIMEHVLRLLARHGFSDTVVTVQFLASLVRNYFGDGEDLGMSLQYVTEPVPLGTAGSVKNAEDLLRDDTFLVISGDALTDFDLTDLVKFHQDKGAIVTVCLTRVPDPLEFGITIVDEENRVQRFLEKPTWGQVFSDTVNTGIYVMEPEVFDHVEAGESVDWSGDVFPKLLDLGLPVYGYVAEGYWEDVGTQESYMRAQADVLTGQVDVDLDAFEVSNGVWVGEGADVHPDAVLRGPLFVGDYAKVEAGAELREFTVVGSNVIVKSGAFLHRAVVHDNVFIGPQTNLRACVIGKNTDVMRAARVEEGAVVGDECVIEEEAIVSTGVRVYPYKNVEAGAVVTSDLIFESRSQHRLFGPRGLSGIVNVEITPELVVRLASAWASTLKKGSTVTTSRDVSRAARALKRGVISALTSSAIDVVDLEVVPVPVARLQTAQGGSAGGVVIRTSPGQPESVDIAFLDPRGADLSQAAQRRLERTYSRGEFRRAFPGEIGDLTFPPRVMEAYTHELLRSIDVTGLPEHGLKVVVDTGGGTASLVLPTLLGRLKLDVLTVNNGLNETSPTETKVELAESLGRLGRLVASSKAAFGVHFDPVGERIALVDEKGMAIDDERALLVVLDLVAAESEGGTVALPVTTTRVAEQVAAFHGVDIRWIATTPAALTEAVSAKGVVFGGDGRGGFVVPHFSTTYDGIAAFVQLVGLVVRTKLQLSEIDARIPRSHMSRRSVPTPWAAKGVVMRAVVEEAGSRPLDTTDGVRVLEENGNWALVLPDPAEPVTHIWAEAGNDATAAALLDRWAEVVSRAGT